MKTGCAMPLILASMVVLLVTHVASQNRPVCRKLDIAVLLDSSGSVNVDDPTNWSKILEFVKALFSASWVSISPDNVQVAVVKFSEIAIVQFYLNDTDTLPGLVRRIDQVTFDDSYTNTAEALEITRTKVFQARKGDRADAPNVAIIITDGNPNRRENDTRPQAALAKAAGIKIIVIEVTNKTDPQLLRDISSGVVLNVDGFGELVASLETLRDGLCNDMTVASPPPTPPTRAPPPMTRPTRPPPRPTRPPTRPPTPPTRDPIVARTRPPPPLCLEQADIAFIADTSGSIGTINWREVVKFLQAFVKHYKLFVSPDYWRVAMTTYDEKAQLVFYLNDTTNADALVDKLSTLAYRGGSSNLADALQLTRERIYVPQRGDRSDVPNTVIVFSDGKPTVRRSDVVNQAQLLMQAGIHIVTVAVGEDVDLGQLATISSEGKAHYVRRYDQLQGDIEEVVDAVCRVLRSDTDRTFPPIGPTDPTGPPGGRPGGTGEEGPTGATGAHGLTGASGTPGAIGPSGPTGATGGRGPTGADGNPGARGDRGNTGSTGATGPTGREGVDGEKGDKGSSGAGSPGPPGRDGIGIKGDAGSSGSNGSTGATGESRRGNPGATGPKGELGREGAVGRVGLTGAKGDEGAKGSIGQTGGTGVSGVPGRAGSEGRSGVQGNPGPVGSTGMPGVSGVQGVEGRRGSSGATGPPGIGLRGDTGSTGMTGPGGMDGNHGATGATGREGMRGLRGSTGVSIPGRQGPPGSTGWTGSQGRDGDRGSPGPSGRDGDPGRAGPTGVKGNRGDQGIGIQGVKGDRGRTGGTGFTGPMGPQGIVGPPGAAAVTCEKNECMNSNGGCEHLCVDTYNSFYCACKPGYINRAVNGMQCPSVVTCQETPYGRICFCELLMCHIVPINGTLCLDVNECQNGNGGCEGICRNSVGSYQCECGEGLRISSDRHTCNDVDECKTPRPPCSFQDICINTYGSYFCIRNQNVAFQKADEAADDGDDLIDGNDVNKDVSSVETVNMALAATLSCVVTAMLIAAVLMGVRYFRWKRRDQASKRGPDGASLGRRFSNWTQSLGFNSISSSKFSVPDESDTISSISDPSRL